jgi:disulfide bond formation protein DsbB
MNDNALDQGFDEHSMLERYGIQAAWLVALVATFGSLYFSEIMHFTPCRLCWFQRILMYPIAVIGLVGISRRDRAVATYILPLSITGIFISGYHYLVQWGVIKQSYSCSATAPCTAWNIDWFGFISIPFLALSAFLLITLATSSAFRSGADIEGQSFRIRRNHVAAILVAVGLLFAVIHEMR